MNKIAAQPNTARKLLLATAAMVAVVSAWAGTASAAPSLAIRVFEDGVLTGLSTSSPSGSSAALNGSTPNFSVVSAFSTGFPAIVQPNFTAQSTSISSLASFTGTHTIRIEFTQTDVLSSSAGGLFAQLASTFTDNLLIGGGVSTVTIANYADAANAAYGETTLLASFTDTSFSGPVGAAGPIVSSLSLPNTLFSETAVISATFFRGGAALQASSQVTAVPEPMSLALLGTGLLGLGLVRNRRKS